MFKKRNFIVITVFVLLGIQFSLLNNLVAQAIITNDKMNFSASGIKNISVAPNLDISIANMSTIDKNLFFTISSSTDTGSGFFTLSRYGKTDRSTIGFLNETFQLNSLGAPFTVNKNTSKMMNDIYNLKVVFNSDTGGTSSIDVLIVINHFGTMALFDNGTVFDNQLYFDYRVPGKGSIKFSMFRSNNSTPPYYDVNGDYVNQEADNLPNQVINYDISGIPDGFYILRTVFREPQSDNISLTPGYVITYTGLEIKHPISDITNFKADTFDNGTVKFHLNSSVKGLAHVRVFDSTKSPRFVNDYVMNLRYNYTQVNQITSFIDSSYYLPKGQYKYDLFFETNNTQRNGTIHLHKSGDITLKRGLFESDAMDTDSFIDDFLFSFRTNTTGKFEAHISPENTPWTVNSIYDVSIVVSTLAHDYYVKKHIGNVKAIYDFSYSFLPDGSNIWINQTIKIRFRLGTNELQTSAMNGNVYSDRLIYQVNTTRDGRLFPKIMNPLDLTAGNSIDISLSSPICCTTRQIPYTVSFPINASMDGDYTLMNRFVSYNPDNTRNISLTFTNVTFLHSPLAIDLVDGTTFSDKIAFRTTNEKTGVATLQIGPNGNNFLNNLVLDTTITFNKANGTKLFLLNIGTTESYEGPAVLKIVFTDTNGQTTQYSRNININKSNPIQLIPQLFTNGSLTINSNEEGTGHITILKATSSCPCDLDLANNIPFTINKTWRAILILTSAPLAPGDYKIIIVFTAGAKAKDAYFVKVDTTTTTSIPVTTDSIPSSSLSSVPGNTPGFEFLTIFVVIPVVINLRKRKKN